MNVYEKFEVLEKKGWKYRIPESEDWEYALTNPENDNVYLSKDLDLLINTLYKRHGHGKILLAVRDTDLLHHGAKNERL